MQQQLCNRGGMEFARGVLSGECERGWLRWQCEGGGKQVVGHLECPSVVVLYCLQL